MNNQNSKINIDEILKVVKKYRRVILLGIIVLVLILVLLNSCSSSTNREESVNDTNSFFIENKDDMRALFNSNGKRLTDFKYKYSFDFVDGKALVTNKDSEDALIDEKGKEVIKFGKYEDLDRSGGLIKARTKKGEYLLSASGKKIMSDEYLNVTSYIGNDTYAAVFNKNQYILYNYDGKKIAKVKESKDDSKPISSSEGYISTFYYNGETLVFNTKTAKIITKIKEKGAYCVSNVFDDESLLLSSCEDLFSSVENVKYKVVKGKKVYDLNCSSVGLLKNNLTCETSGKRVLVDDKYKPMKTDIYNLLVYDNETYLEKDNSTIKVIKSGKVVKELKGYSISGFEYVNKPIYAVRNTEKSAYNYIDEKGNVVIDTNFKKASQFDENGLAVVSEDNEKEYLINESGKKVGDSFERSRTFEGGYYSIGEVDKFKLMNAKGKYIIDEPYKSIEVYNVFDEYYAIVKRNDKTILYNLKNGKKLVETNSSIESKGKYVVVKEDKMTTYYTFSGKKLFSE